MRSTTVVAWLALVAALQGCTAILSTIRVADAQRAVRTVAERDGDALAPYEYTMAEQHLGKAWEESAGSQHRKAVDLARLAKGWAQAAVTRMDGSAKGRTIANAGEDLQDVERRGSESPKPGPVDPAAPWDVAPATPGTARPAGPQDLEQDPVEDQDVFDDVDLEEPEIELETRP